MHLFHFQKCLDTQLTLRSKTQGRGTYSMVFDHYEQVPAGVAKKSIAEGR